MVRMFIISLFLLSCGADSVPEPMDAEVDVRVTTVQSVTRQTTVQRSGLVTREANLRLSFKIPGFIQSIAVKNGQMVRKGQVLARLVTTEIDQQVIKAKTALDKAQRDFKRMESLYRDSVVTLDQYQNVKTALDAAQADYTIASFNQRKSMIIAPVRGRIIQRLAEENEQVAPGTPVVAMTNFDSQWTVEIGLSQSEVVQVQPGDPARVMLTVLPNQKLNAQVLEIAGAPNRENGLYKTNLALIGDTPSRLTTGLIASATISTGQPTQRIRIPARALSEAHHSVGYVYVYRADTGQAERRKVKIDAITDSGVLISAGLRVGEEIVTDGHQNITATSVIRVLSGR